MLFFFDGLSLRLAEARDPGSNSEGRDVPIPAPGSRKMATGRRHAMLCQSHHTQRVGWSMFEKGSVPNAIQLAAAARKFFWCKGLRRFAQSKAS